MAPTAEEDYNGLQSLAERLGLDDNQKEGFISEAMGRLGHKMKTMWEDGEPDNSGGGGSFFGGKPQERRAPASKSASKPWGYS